MKKIGSTTGHDQFRRSLAATEMRSGDCVFTLCIQVVRRDLSLLNKMNFDTFTVSHKASETIRPPTLAGLFAIMADNSRFTSYMAFTFPWKYCVI